MRIEIEVTESIGEVQTVTRITVEEESSDITDVIVIEKIIEGSVRAIRKGSTYEQDQ